MHHVRNLRHAISITTETGECRLVTIGYVSIALQRSRWSVIEWEKKGLLPKAPFIANASRQNIKRRFYPEMYVQELSRITRFHFPGPRLDYTDWGRFQMEARSAFDKHVVPHLGGLLPPIEIELVGCPPAFKR